MNNIFAICVVGLLVSVMSTLISAFLFCVIDEEISTLKALFKIICKIFFINLILSYSVLITGYLFYLYIIYIYGN